MMLHIKFRYQDAYTESDKWSEQECCMKTVKDCIEFYGLNQPNVRYQIISVEEVE